MALTGGNIGFTGYQQPNYAGAVEAAGLPMQAIGQAVGQAADYFKKQGEKKKLIKQSDIQIDAALKLFPDLAPTLQGVRDQIKDENISLNERAGIAESVAGLINMGTNQMQSMAEFGLKKRQLDIEEGRGIQSALIDRAKMQAEAEAESRKPPVFVKIPVPGGEQTYKWDKETRSLVMPTVPVMQGAEESIPMDIPTTTGEMIPANEGVISQDGKKVDYLGQTYDVLQDSVLTPTDAQVAAIKSGLSMGESVIPATRAAGIQAAESLIKKPARIGFLPIEKEAKGEVVTPEEVNRRIASGLSVTAIPIGDGKVRITSQTGSPKPSSVIESPESKLQTQRVLELDKSLGSLREAGTVASLDVEPLKEITKLLDTNVKTGFGRETLMQAQKILGQDVSSEEEFQARVGAEAMKNIALTKGAISDREMDYFKTVLSPNMGKTTEGNKKIIEFRIKYADRANKIAKTISNLQKNKKDPYEIQEAVDEIISSESLLDNRGTEKSKVNQAAEDAEFLGGF